MSAEPTENGTNIKRIRKKRKNFLANAKKYAKKGQMGRGARMSDDLYQYFVGILDAMKQGVEDEEERVALVNNVLERTKGEELNVVGNQLGCRVIELLLPFASAEDLERFMDILSPELRRLCSDNFSSHVVETLLRVSCCRAVENLQNVDPEEDVPIKKKKKSKTDSKYSEEHIQKCYDFTIKICKYALNNLEDFVWDNYANHILRSAIKCLSGITLLPGEKPKTNMFKETVKDDKGIPPHLMTMEYKVVPDEFKEIVKDFANRLSSWPQFKDLPYQNLTSALLQVLLYAVKNVDSSITKDLVKKLLNESFAPDDWVSNESDEKKNDEKVDADMKEDVNESVAITATPLPPVFENQSAVRLLEAALFVARKKMYTQIYAKCFINRLGQLATVPMLNFTVQRLIDNCQVKEEFEPMFDELCGKFSALLFCGNSGVLVAIAKACLRIRARQTQFIASLESALNISEDGKHFSVCCLRLLPKEKIDLTTLDKEYFIHVHGSVILQTILQFQRPAKAVNSLLELSSDELMVILADAKGSHVADAFCSSTCVGVKARDKLIWKLKGFYQKLALSQYGSRAFERIFEAASDEQKVKIMSELSDKSSLLNSTSYGKLIANKLDLATFKLSQKKWEQARLKKSVVEK
ncbi:unnamed protein product [Chilo suppressalis]|uniref:Nucleolar protein 9 n=1 Tax=Chilo suppressalis TaxID=168631 RepID=A0ABN8L4Y2_CHISP|nr:unnamed protein product [Chilo suppressalis]